MKCAWNARKWKEQAFLLLEFFFAITLKPNEHEIRICRFVLSHFFAKNRKHMGLNEVAKNLVLKTVLVFTTTNCKKSCRIPQTYYSKYRIILLNYNPTALKTQKEHCTHPIWSISIQKFRWAAFLILDGVIIKFLKYQFIFGFKY